MRRFASRFRLLKRRRVVLLCCLISLPVGLRVFPVRPGIVVGESMTPTFRDGQVFLMSARQAPGTLSKGDVVVIYVDGARYIKRVRALPGETVWGLDWTETPGHPDYLVSSQVELDRLRRVVARAPALGRIVKMTIPEDCVFVVGDSLTVSYDSRHFGPVPMEAIRGRVIVPSPFTVPADIYRMRAQATAGVP
jgi:signal peptidase I